MADKTIFVDTSMFYALVNQKDEFHHQAKDIWEKLNSQKVKLLTSNYVLDETFTLIRSRRGKSIVDEFRKNLAGQYKIKIMRVLVSDEATAWEWFLLDWADLSFTDCASFALMKRLAIENVASFDNHFKRAGFKLVL